MRCLVLADTFPNRVEPWRGPYHRYQFGELARLCRLEVIAPVRWPRLIRNRKLRRLCGETDTSLPGVLMRHPVLWYVPVLGRAFNWHGVLRAARRSLSGALEDRPDLVVATFAYPHGLAARELAAELGVPYVIKARGTDLHSLPSRGLRRRHTARALEGAAAIVPVSSSLKEIAIELGADPSRIHVLPNGIDSGRFPMIPRAAARRELDLPATGKILAYVGALRHVKGPDLLVDAIEILKHSRPDFLAVVAGTGPRHRAIKRRINRRGLQDRIRLAGRLSPEKVASLMNAADALVLPSRNEGCPNAVLEALSCGTPVIAARVGAVPDLLDDTCGLQVEPDHSLKLARAIQAGLEKDWDRTAIRGRVEKRSWQKNAEQLHQILLNVTEKLPEEAPQKRHASTIAPT